MRFQEFCSKNAVHLIAAMAVALGTIYVLYSIANAGQIVQFNVIAIIQAPPMPTSHSPESIIFMRLSVFFLLFVHFKSPNPNITFHPAKSIVISM